MPERKKNRNFLPEKSTDASDAAEDAATWGLLGCAESASGKWRAMARFRELKNHLGKGFAFERSEKSQNLTPPSIPMNNKRNMNQRNTRIKELTRTSKSIEGGVLKIMTKSKI